MPRESLMPARRIVVKAGTRTLLDDAQKPDLTLISRLLREMVALKEAGRSVIFVSSGAIGTGLAPLGLAKRPDSIPELQAAAAVGQALLMQVYNGVLAPFGYAAAQLLLTHEDFQDRRRYLNMRNVLAALDQRKILPVINENDTVGVEEIKFGDNDLLAGLVSNAVDAEVTVLLSDVEAFLMDGKAVDEVGEVTPEVEAAAGGPSGLGSGGMITKIRCARTVTASGGCLVLAHGKKYTLTNILEGRTPGTLFRARGNRLDHHKRWIAHGLKSAGTLTVDAGGAAALRKNGRSLLPVGVTACDGEFDVGEAVTVRDPQGAEVAKGLVNYSAVELRRIMGKRAEEIERVLGYKNGDEAIHRDNLVILA
ncbi:MAG TPA: glutamate 5-kinase [Planctomycetota bacterium]